MAPHKVDIRPAAGSSRRLIVLAILALVVLVAEPGKTQTPTETPSLLTFFKNYFITGNYVVGSVDLPPNSGAVTATIPMSGVPANADILAVFLYLQTTNTQSGSSGLPSGTLFRGHDISSIAKLVGSSALDSATATCWSNGNASSFTVRSFRVDVLRFLPVGTNPAAQNYQKLLVNDADLTAHAAGPHTVTLPATSSGSQVSSRAGASVVAIYRHPNEPLTGIAMFDGLHILSTGEMTLTLKGFYEPSSSSPAARLTHITSNSGQNSTDQIFFNGVPVETDPFHRDPAFNSTSDRGWNGTLTDVSSSMPPPLPPTDPNYGQQTIATKIRHDLPAAPGDTADCIASTAVVFSTTVQDGDRDGNLDSWESDRSLLGPILDPSGQPLPNLYAMGARPNVQDILAEIGYLKTSGYGQAGKGQGVVTAHSHLPSKAALDAVATAFRNAAPRNGIAAGPINIHFDVGNNYQAVLPTQAECANPATWTPSCAIIPFKRADGSACTAVDPLTGHTPDTACLARGGEAIEETFECTTDSMGNPTPYDCQFPDYVALGWKNGYRFYRDQPLLYPPPPPTVTSSEEACTIAGTACQRRFDRTRKDIFKYALFAHTLGLARLDDPVTPFDESRTPRNVTGMADGGAGGGDLVVTLGLWDNFTGTDFVVSGTFMHELGHTMSLRHGGRPDFSGVNPTFEPNCKPNFQSVMNYVYQIRGLIPISTSPTQGGGDAVIDYSRQEIPSGSPGTVDELNLNEPTGLGSTLYTARWHIPSGGFLDSLGTTIFASRYCNGNPLNGAPPMVALDAITTAIDWSGDGDTVDTGVSQDVNFSGPPADVLKRGSNDWFNLDLRQVGARRNPGSVRIAGAFSLDIQFADLGFGDSGFGDSGFGDSGFGDSGFGDSGFGDSGFGDSGFGDSGFGDSGFGDSGFGDSGAQGDLDFDTARYYGAAPNGLKAVIINNRGDVRLTWSAPPAFQENANTLASPVDFYEIYRVDGRGVTPLNIGSRVLVGGAPVDAPATQVVDRTTQNNRIYTYFGLAQYVSGARSGISNPASITR